MNRSIGQKLSSRKLWTMIIGVVTGIGMFFGGDIGAAGEIASAVLIIASVVSYIITEGKIDAADVAQTARAIAVIAEALDDEEEHNAAEGEDSPAV